MKRLHIHATVRDLAEAIRFYSTLFGQAPARHEPDYAKWLLDDPRVNFAISTWGGEPGIDHLGFQVETEGELAEIGHRLEQAGHAVAPEKDASCCYAVSDKHWVVDPAGTPWETFRTMAQVKTRGSGTGKTDAQRGAESAAAGGETAPARNASAKACCG